MDRQGVRRIPAPALTVVATPASGGFQAVPLALVEAADFAISSARSWKYALDIAGFKQKKAHREGGLNPILWEEMEETSTSYGDIATKSNFLC
jgi:hypothetical protein